MVRERGGGAYCSDLDDTALVLPLILVDLLGQEPGLGTGHERGLAPTPDEEVLSTVHDKYTTVVQGGCYGLNLVPE